MAETTPASDPVEDPAPETPDSVEPDPVEEPPEPEAPPPVVIEAGARMGPIRIGMTQEELDALGLEATDVDPRSRRYGPYRVWVRRGAVDQIEAEIGQLGRIQHGEQVFEAGVDIYTLRDAFPECVWVEGGGERYECAGRRLSVRTTHTLDPLRYTLGVRSR